MKNQFCNSLIDLFRTFPDEETCLEYLEKHYWPNGAVSPFDPTSEVIYYGNHRYRCKNTRKYFTVKTGTLFHSTKNSLSTWFAAIWLLSSSKKGISSMQLARDLQITQKTAWHLLHRIRKCYFCENQSMLQNEVELDETFVGGKNKNRHFDKKVKHSQGRSFKDKTPVLGMLERKGKVVCRVVKSTSSKHLTLPICKTIDRNATLYTDEWDGYKLARIIFKDNHIVNHGRRQYVNGKAHTNTIEGFWSLLKRGIIGIYHRISKKHLQRYVDEFVFRYNTRELNNGVRFNLLLCNINHRLTFNELIYG